MLKKIQTRVAGPAGDIELSLDLPDQPSNIAVLCHPHPLYGGSMHDGVLQIAADALLNHDLGVARFNFHGVGASQGISGKTTDEEKSAAPYAPPEVGDLLAVTRWLANEHNAPAPLCAGYSFGAHVLWHALSLLTAEQALMIAPPTAAMTFQHIEHSTPKRIHTVWCDDDDFVDSNYFADKPNVECLTLSGGGHFFAGQADNLASAVVSALIRSPIRE